MHKKIESEIVSLAHSLLQMKNKEDVLALKEKAGEIYEKLSVLAFVDRYIESTLDDSKPEILKKMVAMDSIIEEEVISDMTIEPLVFKTVEEKVIEVNEADPEAVKEEIPEPVVAKETEVVEEESVVVEDLFSSGKVQEKKEVQVGAKNTLEEELKDTISLDVTTDLFENAVRVDTPKKSLNDVLVRKNLQIGLNDRIAFVKHLFDGSQQDFNRVVSQLNSFKSEKEALKFIAKIVKLDYDWNEKEEYEERFITLITRKFA